MRCKGRNRQDTVGWGTLGCLFALSVASVMAQPSVIEPEQDPRLRTPVTLMEPAISLGELCTALMRQTKVRLSVASGWRDTRVVVYVQNRPLHELMMNIPKIAPQLEWKRFRYSDGSLGYHLRATRPDPPLPTCPSEAEIVRRARAFVETLRKALREPEGKLEARAERFIELASELYSTPGEEGLSIAREMATLEPYLVAAVYKGLIEPEVYTPSEREAIQWAVPLLLSLRANEWSLLQQGGQITVAASRHPAYPRALVAQYRARQIQACEEDIRSAESEEELNRYLERKAHKEQITDVWVCIYVGDKLTVAARPVMGDELGGFEYEDEFQVEKYAVPNEPKEILLELYGGSPDYDIPDDPIFRQPFPDTPDWIRRKVNWYNDLGCLLLEGAAAINRPLLAIHYPFNIDRAWQVFAYSAKSWADIFEKILIFAHLIPSVEKEWLLFSHAKPWTARRSDVSDALLQRTIPMPDEQGWAYFEKVALAAKLLNRYQKEGVAETLGWFPLMRRYLLAPERNPADSELHFIFSDMVRETSSRILWQLYHSLSPAQQARLKAGEPLSVSELNLYQQYLCWRAVSSQPFEVGLSRVPSPTAFVELRYNPQVGEPRPLLPPTEVLARIFKSGDSKSAYQAWLQSLTPQERERLEQIQRTELWDITVWWSEEYLAILTIMRIFAFSYPSFYNPMRAIMDEEE